MVFVFACAIQGMCVCNALVASCKNIVCVFNGYCSDGAVIGICFHRKTVCFSLLHTPVEFLKMM